MGIISRFKSIMESNINATLDKLEDPSKLVDQALRDLNEDLVKVKKETASVMAEEKRCQRAFIELNNEMDNYNKAIKASLLAGNEDDARVLIAKKNEKQVELDSINQALKVAQANSQKMRDMHDKLVSDINTLNRRRQTIKSQVAMAEVQKRVNKVSSSINTASSLDQFSRMEAKAQNMLDSALSEAELNAQKDDTQGLLDKYNGVNTDQSVEDEINRLKSELGLE